VPTCIGQILAIIFGIISLVSIKNSQGRMRGMGLAIAALVIAPMFLLSVIPAGMLLPALSRAREEARRVVCKQNLLQIGLATSAYTQNNNNKLPTTGKPNDSAASLALLYPGYLNSLQVFRCPSTVNEPAWPLTESGCSYQYLSTVDPNAPPNTIIAFDKDGNHMGGRNALFMDGHISWMTEDQFQSQLAEQQKKAPAGMP
jgi:prepilin-type processing-associated H-X9-DG protein